MGRLYRFLASVRLAAWILGALLVSLFVSFLVPQRGIVPTELVDEFLLDLPGILAALIGLLELDAFFTSPLFLLVTALLVLNVTFCTIRRIQTRLRSRGRAARCVAPPQDAVVVETVDAPDVDAALRSKGAQAISCEGGTQYVLRRGDVGFVGSVILHVALVLFVVGGIVTALTTFRGEVVLTEGQSFVDVPEAYLDIAQSPRTGEAFRDFRMTLEGTQITYEGDDIVDAVSVFRIEEARGVSSQDARVNYPVSVQGKSFLLQESGHSVWVTVTDEDGDIIADSFVNLAAAAGLGYADELPIEDATLTLYSRPDGSRPLDEPVTHGLDLVSPIVGVTLSSASTDEPVWVAVGETATVGGWDVTVREVRLWTRLLVRADGGRTPVYAGFLLVIVGVVMRFLDPDRVIRVEVSDDGGGTARIWAKTRYRKETWTEGARALARSLEEAPDDG